MTETLFYHLERRTLEDVLPGLVEKSLARGWRAVVKTDNSERSDALDNLLWTYDDQSFLAHAQSGDGEAARQPVLIRLAGGGPFVAHTRGDGVRRPRCIHAGPGAGGMEKRQGSGP